MVSAAVLTVISGLNCNGYAIQTQQEINKENQLKQDNLAIEEERKNERDLTHQLRHIGYSHEEIERIFSEMKVHNARANDVMSFMERQDRQDSSKLPEQKFHVRDNKGVQLNSFRFIHKD